MSLVVTVLHRTVKLEIHLFIDLTLYLILNSESLGANLPCGYCNHPCPVLFVAMMEYTVSFLKFYVCLISGSLLNLSLFTSEVSGREQPEVQTDSWSVWQWTQLKLNIFILPFCSLRSLFLMAVRSHMSLIYLKVFSLPSIHKRA